MRIRTVLCIALLGLVTGLTACGSSDPPGPDRAACKAARTEQLRKELAEGRRTAPGDPPAECAGIDAKTMQRYTSEILETKLPATPVPDITSACRAWIKQELLSGSRDIGGTSDKGPCGYLSERGLDMAILNVSRDMTGQESAPAS